MDIENEFKKMQDWYEVRNANNQRTGQEVVLQFLYDNLQSKIWWWSWEFIGKNNSKGEYLSHRAPARASDLALHTEFVEDRSIGRFKVYRLKTEKLPEIKSFLGIN